VKDNKTHRKAAHDAENQDIQRADIQRAAFSIAEFSRMFGKTPTWGHRQEYAGRIQTIRGLGRKLVPRSEVNRLLAEANLIAGHDGDDASPKTRTA
jgi:hypothetical protein